MNQSQEQRLEEIFRTNDNKGIAIAITGSWGVGKTFFWNKFRESYKLKNKYVYVSLFGLESLSDLKTHIYSNIENNHSALEIPRWIRGLPSIFKDTRISQFGISASAKVFDSLMFNQVKDAVICFDDFERMSNKLDIKDVMGLANQLKLERNCQVVLILDEDKAEGENKKKYAEYKEKLIDETIKITSVEPLIRANTKDIDNDLVNLMVKFAKDLEIHNFRFFQKVIKLYVQFLEQLPEVVAYSTKEIILIRILQGYLIEDFGEALKINWEDFAVEKVVEILDKDDDDIEINTIKKLADISYALVSSSDVWFVQFKKWFEQMDRFDEEQLSALATSELISERTNLLKENRSQLLGQFWNNKIDENFSTNLYDRTLPLIGILEIESLDFTCHILRILGSNQLAYQLKVKIYQWINDGLGKDKFGFIDQFASLRQSKNCFYKYIDKYENKNLYVGLPSLLEVVNAYVINRGWSPEHVYSLEIASKEDWQELLFEQIPNDERFVYQNSSLVATKMIKQSMKPELNTHIRKMIIEIYKEKGKESEFYKNYMDYLISRLDQ